MSPPIDLLYVERYYRGKHVLKLDHIHVDRQVIFVESGKGQKDRYVPIGLRALLWIARYVEHARDQLAIDPNERALFLTVDGTPIQPDSLTEYGRRYIKAAKVDKPGACHIYQHTMATLMHDAGADIRDIQAIFGHAKLDTTQIYTRVSLKKLLDTHSKTHPAEKPDPDSESTDDDRQSASEFRPNSVCKLPPAAMSIIYNGRHGRLPPSRRNHLQNHASRAGAGS